MRKPCRTFLEVGDRVEFTRTITGEDIDLFAKVTGDYDPVHVDADYAATTAFGRRIAHGAHVMGLLSTASAEMSRRSKERGTPGTPVSAGYDRIRFTWPVFIDDTLTVRYTIEEVDDEAGKTRSHLEITNQDGKVCLVGTHILAWVLA